MFSGIIPQIAFDVHELHSGRNLLKPKMVLKPAEEIPHRFVVVQAVAQMCAKVYAAPAEIVVAIVCIIVVSPIHVCPEKPAIAIVTGTNFSVYCKGQAVKHLVEGGTFLIFKCRVIVSDTRM